MNPKPIAQAKNPLLAAALPALLRARQRAEEIGIATNTPLVQVIDGKVVRVYPQGGLKVAAAGHPSPRHRSREVLDINPSSDHDLRVSSAAVRNLIALASELSDDERRVLVDAIAR